MAVSKHVRNVSLKTMKTVKPELSGHPPGSIWCPFNGTFVPRPLVNTRHGVKGNFVQYSIFTIEIYKIYISKNIIHWLLKSYTYIYITASKNTFKIVMVKFPIIIV